MTAAEHSLKQMEESPFAHLYAMAFDKRCKCLARLRQPRMDLLLLLLPAYGTGRTRGAIL